jgi:Flp pilus assembly secretin CpaC
MRKVLCFIPIIGIFFMKSDYLENQWFFVITGAVQAISVITFLYEADSFINYFIK